MSSETAAHENSGGPAMHVPSSNVNCACDRLARDTAALRTTANTHSSKLEKIGVRAWHMCHDMAGIRMDIADINDDNERIFNALEEIKHRTSRMDAELAHLRTDIAQMLNIVRELA